MRERDRQRIRNQRIGSGGVIYEDQVVDNPPTKESRYEALRDHYIHKLTTQDLLTELCKREGVTTHKTPTDPRTTISSDTRGTLFKVSDGTSLRVTFDGEATILVIKS